MNHTALFESIAEDSPDGVVLVGHDGVIRFWNRTAERMFGHRREDAMGRRLHDWLLLPDAEHRQELSQAAMLDGATVAYDAVARCADGALLYVNAASRRLASNAGEPLGELYNLADVTQPKTRRDARVLDLRYRELLDSVPDAIVVVNGIGRVVLINRQAETMFGHRQRDLVGEALNLLLPERFRATHGQHRERYMARPHTRPMGPGLELYGLRKNGEEFPVEISLSPLRTDVGLFGMSAIRDISERRRVERALEEKNVELERANRAKDRFLATMSHELRTPLNAIIGFTGILLMRLPGPLTADQEKQLGMVESSGKHLLSLINDLLDLAKIESGNVRVDMVDVDCGELVDEVATSLRPSASAKGLELQVEMPPGVTLVRADRRALRQILLNLAGNAIKFSERGWVRMFAERVATADGTSVWLGVADSGVGLTEAEQAQLFQAFVQVGGASQRARVEGTGLGLYLCRKLAELHGSRIELQSEPGVGSRFWLSLPVAGAAANEP